MFFLYNVFITTRILLLLGFQIFWVFISVYSLVLFVSLVGLYPVSSNSFPFFLKSFWRNPFIWTVGLCLNKVLLAARQSFLSKYYFLYLKLISNKNGWLFPNFSLQPKSCLNPNSCVQLPASYDLLFTWFISSHVRSIQKKR